MKLEFYVSPEGELRVVDKEKGQDFSLLSRKNLCADLALQICTQFHDSWTACVNEAKRLKPRATSSEWEGMAVQRFIRCNFGERDIIPDWNEGNWELEEVACHLRGICPYQGVICHPRYSKLSEKEEEGVAHLCIGNDSKKISEEIFRSWRAIRDILQRAREKLRCNSNEEMIHKCRGLHLERRYGLI